MTDQSGNGPLAVLWRGSPSGGHWWIGGPEGSPVVPTEDQTLAEAVQAILDLNHAEFGQLAGEPATLERLRLDIWWDGLTGAERETLRSAVDRDLVDDEVAVLIGRGGFLTEFSGWHDVPASQRVIPDPIRDYAREH